MSFVHLHVHSEYSLLDGASKVKNIVSKVKSMGQKAVALTDHGTMSGVAEFHAYCRKAGIKPILGLETYVAPDCEDFEHIRVQVEAFKKENKEKKPKSKSKKNPMPLEEKPSSYAMHTMDGYYSWLCDVNPDYYGNSYPNRRNRKGCGPYVYGDAHLVLLAKNLQGYRNLCKISSEAGLRGYYYSPRSDMATLRQYGKGIIALSACLAGEIPRLLLRNEFDLAIAKANAYREIFDEFYLEIQPGQDPDQIRMNEEILKLSEATGIPVVVTTDAHYVDQDDAPFHRQLIQINTHGGMTYAFQEDIYFLWSEAELRMYGFEHAFIQTTAEIAERIEEYEIAADHFLLPHFPVPEGFTDDTYLANLAQNFMYREIERFPAKNRDQYWERLFYELSVMRKKDMSGYMLIVWDFIQWAKTHNLYIGPGRGSSAGSLVAYLLRITTLDPIEHELMFERFTNPDRPGMPDIDTDFEEYLPCPDGLEDRTLFRSGRDLTTRYVKERYGEECVCKIITHGELGAKMVLKDIARVLTAQNPENPITQDEVTKVNKFIPSDAGVQWSLQDCLEGDPQNDKKPVVEMLEFRKKYPQLFEAALHLEGLKRTSSTHAAAVVITPKPVKELIPLKRDPKDGSMVSQFDMKYVENLKLTKMDFLGLKNLGILHHAHDFVLQRHGIDLDIDELPLSDPKAMALIRAGMCSALFQVESEGMREMFRKMEDVTFPDLVAGIALYRPGPMQFIPDYVSRRNGITEPEYSFPELKPLLESTYGILIYQEQAMYIARDIAGFNNVQMDGFRKGIGKKDKDVIAQQIDWLVNGNEKEGIPGLVKNGVPRELAEKLGEDLVAFGSYCFNKSHAAAYAKIVSQTAYMKAHYPVEYMAAVLTCNTGTTDDPIAYIQEAMNMGIEILPPDINRSRYEFVPEGPKAIRFGLGSIRNVVKAAYLMVEERDQNGPYSCMEEWQIRTREFCNDKVRSSLILAGCFDDLYPDKTRRDILYLNCTKAEMETLQLLKNFLVEEELISLKTRKGTQILDSDPALLAQAERHLLKFYLKNHPLRGKAEPTRWEGLGNREKFEVVFQLLDFRTATTKRGKAMCFLKIDTLEGEKEIVMWEDVMDKAFSKLHKGVLYRGTIEYSRWNDKDSFTVKTLKYFKEDAPNVPDLRSAELWALPNDHEEVEGQPDPVPV